MSEPRSVYLDGQYLPVADGWHESDGAWKAAQIEQLLRDEDLQPASVLDVGCGTGAVLDALALSLPASTCLVGIDPSPQAVAVAQELRSARVHIVEGSVKDCDGQFDLMLVLDVIEHVEDCFGFLRSLHGRARHAIFHIPLDMNGQHVIRPDAIMNARRLLGHLHYFSRDTALATLADTGWKVDCVRFTGSGIDAPDLPWKLRLARWPRMAVMRVNRECAVRWLGGSSLLVMAHS